MDVQPALDNRDPEAPANRAAPAIRRALPRTSNRGKRTTRTEPTTHEVNQQEE